MAAVGGGKGVDTCQLFVLCAIFVMLFRLILHDFALLDILLPQKGLNNPPLVPTELYASSYDNVS